LLLFVNEHGAFAAPTAWIPHLSAPRQKVKKILRKISEKYEIF
jgi:hypothetical protein